jgi:hypothetical protein
MYRCQVVEGCEGVGDHVDHIRPVYPGMSDAEFYDISNLRAACRRHNLARYYADLLQPGVTPEELEHGAADLPRVLTYGNGRPRRGSIF